RAARAISRVLTSPVAGAPRCRPCPYTSLFRSLLTARGVRMKRITLLGATGAIGLRTLELVSGHRELLGEAGDELERAQADRAGGDRRSTRLNSSHQIISYAVCCLTKIDQHHAQ